MSHYTTLYKCGAFYFYVISIFYILGVFFVKQLF